MQYKNDSETVGEWDSSYKTYGPIISYESLCGVKKKLL